MISVRNAYSGRQEFYSEAEITAFTAALRRKSLYSGTHPQLLAHYLYPQWRKGAGKAYEVQAHEEERLALTQELAAIKAELAEFQRDYDARRMKAAASTTPAVKYNPNQPRVPGGNENGGQWTSGGGGGELAFTVTPRFIGSGSGTGSGTGIGGDGGAILVAGIGSVIGQLIGIAARGAASLLYKKTSDIVAPRGKAIGYKNKGATDDIRTVSKEQFEAIKAELEKGAKRIPNSGTYESYKGKLWQRNDRTIYGIRKSGRFGETIDLFNNKAINRIHYK